jgi:hypothetical protein
MNSSEENQSEGDLSNRHLLSTSTEPSLESSLRQQAKFDLEAEGYGDEEEGHSQVQSGASITFKLINNTQRVTPLTSSMILR